MLFQRLAFHSGNQIYGLIFNGLKKLYDRVGSYYFSNPQARDLALQFYRDLLEVCDTGNRYQILIVVRLYGMESSQFWNELTHTWPTTFTDK